MSISKGIRKRYPKELDEEIVKLYSTGEYSRDQLSLKLNAPRHKIDKVLRKHKVKLSKECVKKHKTTIPQEQISSVLKLAYEDNLTEQQIANLLNISLNRIKAIKARHKGSLKRTKEQWSELRTTFSKNIQDQILTLRDKWLTVKEIANKLNIKESTVIYVCNKNNKTLPNEGFRQNLKKYDKEAENKILKLSKKELTKREIAEETGVTFSKVKRHLLENNIKRPEIATKYTWDDVRSVCKELNLIPINIPKTEDKVFDTSNPGIWRFKCFCGNEYSPNLNSILMKNSTSCGCILSRPQTELRDWLKSLNLEVLSNKYNLISPYQIDEYLPKYNIGIEFNGLYWHGELRHEKDAKLKQINKTIKCREKNIRLIQIFEDEWLLKNNQTKGFIKSILNLNDIKINARDCTFVKNGENVQTFLEDNHIQGNAFGLKYCLFYKNELAAVAIFSKPNASRNTIGDEYLNTYELSRYCVKIDHSVRGGLGKLLSKFKLDHPEVNKIISYSDNRWSEGNIYRKLNFVKTSEGSPSYWYFKRGSSGPREHRYKYRKSVLIKNNDVNPNKTEWEIMKELKYDRIWDCGSARWELIL